MKTHNLQIADCVYYGLDSFGEKKQSWRITSFMREVPYVEPKDMPYDSYGEEIINAILQRDFNEKWIKWVWNNGKVPTKVFRLQWCSPDVATHVSLAAVTGATAKIEDVEYIGPIGWEQYAIDREREEYQTYRLLGEFSSKGVYFE